ncbi:MAG: NYN domain-containing protein [Nostoc sp.]|uniref:NYN domain-containing protein n=1 Tax=Nostoc sp. TaxID=1180 RepID=UPI002FF73186
MSYSSGIKNVKYLFIDGGCLDSLLESFSDKLFGKKQLEIDYCRLANGYHKVFYYDCLPAQKQGENQVDYQNRIKPKIKLFNHLKSLDRFHVYEGTARFRDKRRGQEQKEVDIMIAVDMYRHSSRKNMDEATLLTSDLDFKPLIDALVQEGMYVSLWYPKTKANYELVDAADSRQALTVYTVWGWLTEDFRKKVSLPIFEKSSLLPIDDSWTQVDNIEQSTYEVFVYEKENNYIAVFQTIEGDYNLYQHNNLDQLKFFIVHIHSPDVIRYS